MNRLPTYTFTPQGYEDVKQEYEKLLSSRPAAVEDLAKARSLGDLKENGYYKAARMKLNSVDHRLRQLKLFIKYGKVVQATQTEYVQVGNTVTVSDGKEEKTYMIVGSNEANPSAGKLSDFSPIGKALIGKRVGEVAEISVPSGAKQFTVKNIS